MIQKVRYVNTKFTAVINTSPDKKWKIKKG